MKKLLLLLLVCFVSFGANSQNLRELTPEHYMGKGIETLNYEGSLYMIERDGVSITPIVDQDGNLMQFKFEFTMNGHKNDSDALFYKVGTTYEDEVVGSHDTFRVYELYNFDGGYKGTLWTSPDVAILLLAKISFTYFK